MRTIARHPLRLLPFLVVLLLTLLAPTPAAAATLGCSDDARGTADLSAWVPEMLAATNAHRESKGLAPLQLDATLTRASAWKSRDLAVRGYFGHDDPAGTNGEPARSPWERLAECGFTAEAARAENIAAGQRSGAAFVRAWIESPGHRANIENASMRYVGFGVVSLASSRYDTYATQMFSSSPGAAATTTPGATEPVRQVLEGGGGSAADPAPTTTSVRGSAVVTRTRCRSRVAVGGWCWYLTIRGRVAASAPGAITGRRAIVTRQAGSARRYVAVGTATTSADGTFVVRRLLAPPRRGTSAWLRANARIARVRIAPTPALPTAAATLVARVRA